MPLATSLVWRLGTEEGEAEEGKVDIHLSSIFVNGVKRRRIVDLSEPPYHDGLGSLRLSFNCGGEVRARFVGGPLACEAFVEDCAEVLQRKTGTPIRKRKLDVASPARKQTGAMETPSKKTLGTGVPPSAACSGDETGMDLVSEESSATSVAGRLHSDDSKSVDMLKESLGQSLQVLSESSPARPFVTALWVNLGRGSVAESIMKAAEVFDGRAKKQEQEHQEQKKAIRAEVFDIQGRCERLVRGREALEQQLKLLGTRLNTLKDDNAHLERKLRGMNTGPQPGPGAKRARATQKTSSAKPEPSASTQEEFVRSLVTLEVAPLLQCAVEAREALKKKIMLKWHPDKQPSEEHKSLATQVMQELQNNDVWSCRGS